MVDSQFFLCLLHFVVYTVYLRKPQEANYFHVTASISGENDDVVEFFVVDITRFLRKNKISLKSLICSK